MAPRQQHAYMLLTWSQVGENFDYFKAVELIGDHHGECIISHEFHEDGGHHYHAFCHFEPRLRTRDTTIFDVDGFHPNWQPKKEWGTVGMMCRYVMKEGADVVGGGLDWSKYTEESPDKMTRDDKAKLVLQASSEAEAWSLVKEHLPANSLFNFNNVKGFINHTFGKQKEDKYVVPAGRVFDISKYPDLKDWVDLELRLEIPGKFYSFWFSAYCLGWVVTGLVVGGFVHLARHLTSGLAGGPLSESPPLAYGKLEGAPEYIE